MEIYMSKEQYNKLKEELEYLKNVERKKIAERIKNAIELGDISENAEYDSATTEKENLERKILEIENILRSAKIIKSKFNQNSNLIVPGKKFEAIEKKTGKLFTFTLVGFGEGDLKENKIDIESPLGKAFLNKKVGDLVEVQAPKGKIIYQVKKIFS
jgi:transcription elongation factor GreA